MAAPEAMGEFYAYNGDCVWAALLMALHKLDPSQYPLSGEALNQMVKEAQAEKIGVGGQGQADRAQLEHMMTKWGVTYTNLWTSDTAIPADKLNTMLLDALSAGNPVLLGFTNGQALPGDEKGLQGHEIAALRFADPKNPYGGYACGDGDNEICIQHGKAVTYLLHNLIDARCNSAYRVLQVGSAGDSSGVGTSDPVSIATKLTATNSFMPLAQALDDAQQFDSFDIGNPFGSLWANVFPFFARLAIVLLGAALVIGAMSWYWRQGLGRMADSAGHAAQALAPAAEVVAA